MIVIKKQGKNDFRSLIVENPIPGITLAKIEVSLRDCLYVAMVTICTKLSKKKPERVLIFESMYKILFTAERKRASREGKSHSGDGKTVLYITNLVRPFMINQLRELLQRTGKIVDDGFWIDSIKSKCYVQVNIHSRVILLKKMPS